MEIQWFRDVLNKNNNYAKAARKSRLEIINFAKAIGGCVAQTRNNTKPSGNINAKNVSFTRESGRCVATECKETMVSGNVHLKPPWFYKEFWKLHVAMHEN